MAQDAPRLAMVAGEASGDLLAAAMLSACRGRWPGLQAMGIGGPAMLAQGFEAWWPQSRLAVRGYVEVLPRLRELLAMRRALAQRLLAQPPDVFMGVDAPDFNLDLEVALRERGVPTVHFVSPSFWAWRAGKIDKLRRAAGHVLCIFPFEPELLQAHGVPATYVGHPLAQVIPMQPDRVAARRVLGLPEQARVLALLPGSRTSELKYIAPRFLQAARLLLAERPELQLVLPALPALREAAQALVAAAGLQGRVMVTQGQSHQVLAACDVTLIASGTATLEAALFKRPMVIAYHMNWLSWQIMRRKKLQPWVGLPNILCQDFVVPELLQEAATPHALAAAVAQWLDDLDRAPQRIAQLHTRFTALHHELQRDTATLASDAIAQVLRG
ncbi:MAG: lipid-A-disaccharide synthase [Pseudomonadota bacterium]|jgi:lipid-A-disaccharide synthase